MFLFTDAHVANEGFLELINNMLTSGMIPALYEDAEKDALVSGIREKVDSTMSKLTCGFIRVATTAVLELASHHAGIAFRNASCICTHSLQLWSNCPS